MNRTASLFASLGLLAALAPSTSAQTNDQYVFQIDTVRTAVRFVVETDLHGLCVPVVDDECPLTGSLEVELHGGVLPIDSGKYDGGHVVCAPHLLSIVPNALRLLPPILEIDAENLAVRPNGTDYVVAANGLFTTWDQFEVLSGNLVLRPLGLQPITVPLVGMTSDNMRTHGEVRIDDQGIRLVREIGNTLVVDVPLLGLQVRIALRGVVEAQFSYPAAADVCPATPNSVGLGAVIDLDGTVSVSRDDLVLGIVGCPPNARTIAILGNVRANVVFDAGHLCIGGPLARLGSLEVGLDGTGLLDVHLADHGVLVGSTAILQVVYRDGTALDLSNALEILSCP